MRVLGRYAINDIGFVAIGFAIFCGDRFNSIDQ